MERSQLKPPLMMAGVFGILLITISNQIISPNQPPTVTISSPTKTSSGARHNIIEAAALILMVQSAGGILSGTTRLGSLLWHLTPSRGAMREGTYSIIGSNR